MELAGKRILVLGLGETGMSMARWLGRRGADLRVADTRDAPPELARLQSELPGVAIYCGGFPDKFFSGIELVAISPGVPLADPAVSRARAHGLPVVGDIELFAQALRGAWTAPVLAITGTNGKSTVTALAGEMCRAAGLDCEIAGNIGPAALDALARCEAEGRHPAAWVLELSSFQLETTLSLEPAAAAMLNLSEDHLDRYAGLDDYGAAKARIFQGQGVQIVNRDDPRSLAMARPGRKLVLFGLDARGDFGVKDGALMHGATPIVNSRELQIHGSHNVANALAACALAHSLGVSPGKLTEGLRSFKGLPHRLELVAHRRGVDWYDDSKGTNVGATVAALKGLNKKSVLILGGQGKGQDFAPLRDPAKNFSVKVLLFGRDAPLIEQALRGLPTERCASLEEAVRKASEIQSEAVLLSPACASFDMFRDYRHRGEVFAAAVKALKA